MSEKSVTSSNAVTSDNTGTVSPVASADRERQRIGAAAVSGGIAAAVVAVGVAMTSSEPSTLVATDRSELELTVIDTDPEASGPTESTLGEGTASTQLNPRSNRKRYNNNKPPLRSGVG